MSLHAGACEALVDEGVTGFAIDPDDTETFAARLKTLCEDAPLRDAMSQASRRAGESLSAHQRAADLAAWMRHHFSPS